MVSMILFATGIMAFIAGLSSLRNSRRRTTPPSSAVQARATHVPEVALGEEVNGRLETGPVLATGYTLPTLVSGPRAPGWWGILFLIFIEIMVFGSLMMSYYYLSAGEPRWPPAGIDPPDLLLPSLNSLILLATAVPIYWATRRIRRGDRTGLLIGLGLAIIMGIVFLALKWVEYSNLDYNWATNAYGSIVWTMTGFHAVHVLAVVLKTAAIWVVGWQGYFNERRYVAVDGNSVYWYFVIGIWIPLYLTIYIASRFL
jgi:cytochrome c oxidase subunit III